ncbi:MAG: hypothetical protein OEY91_14010 [Nitrospirota bacterium]|nr:hypothetical protein [Nitrospirota bacterium]
MTKSFILTIDVEIDAGRKWKTSNPATYEGVDKGIATLQRLCNDYGIKPVYLISPAVLVDQRSVDYLGSLDTTTCELGTHLHGEYIGPNAKYPGPDFSGCDPQEMQCQYEKEIEYQKLENLTNTFTSLFGYAPVSFRAGRFGARGWTIHCLEQLGYTHDTSVTPHRNWHDIADFSRPGSLSPYHPSTENICAKGQSHIVEVPVSITPNLEWLRPTPRFSNLDQCKTVIDWYEAHVTPTVLCCMFHNVELVPGKNPYCQTEEDCHELLHRIEGIFQVLQERNYQCHMLKEVTVEV